MDVYLAIAGIVSLWAGTVTVLNRLDRRRCRALEEEGQQLGFSFMRVAKPFEGSDIRGLAFCLHEGPFTQVENFLTGTIRDCRMLVFNLRAYSSLGEGSTVTTYAAFQSRPKQLPVFQVRVKGILDRCRDALAGNRLDFDIDPEFAKRFLLRCEDDTEKHRFFTNSRLLHIRQCADDFHIQTSPDWLVMFRPGGIITAKKFRQFVDVTSAIASGLLDFEPRLPGHEI